MAYEEPISEPIDRRHSDLYHRFGRPDIVGRAPTDASRLGWWRTWGRHKGEPCPVCGGKQHSAGCAEAEHEIAQESPESSNK